MDAKWYTLENVMLVAFIVAVVAMAVASVKIAYFGNICIH